MDLFDIEDDPFNVPPTTNPFTASNSALPPNIQAIHAPKLCECLELICEHSIEFEQPGTNWIDASASAGQEIISNQVISFNGVGNQFFNGYVPPQTSMMGYQQEFNTAVVVTPFQNIPQAGIPGQQNLRTPVPIVETTAKFPAPLNLYEAAYGVPTSGSYQVAENLSLLDPNPLPQNSRPVTHLQNIHPGAPGGSGTLIGQATLPLQTISPEENVTFNGKSFNPRDPNWEQFVWPMSCYSSECPLTKLRDYRDYRAHLRNCHDREPMCPDCEHPLGTGTGSLLAFYEHIYEAHLRSGLGSNPTPGARFYQIQF